MQTCISIQLPIDYLSVAVPLQQESRSVATKVIRSALCAWYCRRTDRSVALATGARNRRCGGIRRDRGARYDLVSSGYMSKGPTADVTIVHVRNARQRRRLEGRQPGQHGRGNDPRAIGRRFEGRKPAAHDRANVSNAVGQGFDGQQSATHDWGDSSRAASQEQPAGATFRGPCGRSEARKLNRAVANRRNSRNISRGTLYNKQYAKS